MNLDSFTGPGSTPRRRRFWDKITEAVNASQKIEGSNVSIEEHQGMGTLIDVSNSNRRPTPGGTTGGCCQSSGDDIICTPGLTETDCTGGGGYYLGDDTTCDGSPCAGIGLGACCDGCNGCTLTTEEGCPLTIDGVPGWLGLESCTFGTEAGNVCCPSDTAVTCCVAGEIFNCLDFCIDIGGCPLPCAPSGSPCSCDGIAPDAESVFSDPFFTNN